MENNAPKLQVLGAGCPTCKRLLEITKTAAKEMGLGGEVGYITDMHEILKLGLMSSPVLTVNGKVALVGYVPNVEEIKKAISKNL